MSAGFDRLRFYDLLDEIETYLGYLRGNENAWEYLEQVYEANLHSGRKFTNEGIYLEDDYRFPCPDGRFRLQFKPLIGAIGFVTEGHYPGEYMDYVKEVQRQTDAAWHTGATWAAGISGYARSICEQFVAPSVSELTGGMIILQRDVVTPLTASVYDDWASLGNLTSTWHGEASASFSEFYQNFNEALTLFAVFSGLVTSGVGFTTAIVNGTQAGAMQFVQELRDNLVTQLDMWVQDGRPPRDPAPTPAWIGDVMTFAEHLYGVIEGFIPPLDKAVAMGKEVVDTVKNVVDDVQGRVESLENLTGKDILPDSGKRVSVRTAAEVYEHLTRTLKEDYLDKFHQSLDGVHNGGLRKGGDIEAEAFSGRGVVELMDDLQKRRNWELPSVPDENLASDEDTYA